VASAAGRIVSRPQLLLLYVRSAVAIPAAAAAAAAGAAATAAGAAV